MMDDLKNFLKSFLGLLIGAIIGLKISLLSLDRLPISPFENLGNTIFSSVIIILFTLAGGCIGARVSR